MTKKIISKGELSNRLRRFRLIWFSDLVRYYLEKWKNQRINKDFRRNNPEVALPPDYLMYESFRLDYAKYYTDGLDTARWLTDYLLKYIDLSNRKILDWGCGPGRIIRHLPLVTGRDCEFYGTDYNPESIRWCRKNLPGIHFNLNAVTAKLPYADAFFDVIYGISVFTHLSREMHYNWFAELFRILKPDGVMFFTTQGDNYRVKLTSPELDQYDRNELVVRGNVKEGHRTYSAFQPKEFMTGLFAGTQILEHVETKPGIGKWLPQDIWIIRKIS